MNDNDIKHIRPFTQEELQNAIPKIDWSPNEKESFSEKNRANMVDRMYKTFIEIQNAPVVIPLNKFIKFIPLFNRLFFDSVDVSNISECDNLKSLCNEFTNMINPYKEYHVEVAPNEFITFPPIFNPINMIDFDKSSSVDKLHNMMIRCQDRPDKIGYATAEFLQALASSQSPESILLQQKKFRLITDRLKQDRLGIVEDNEEVNNVSDDGTEFLEFVPD